MYLLSGKIDELMKRRLFHLYLKKTDQHKYYGSLAAVFLDNKDLQVSEHTLYKYNFDIPYENNICIIRKSYFVSAGDVRNQLE